MSLFRNKTLLILPCFLVKNKQLYSHFVLFISWDNTLFEKFSVFMSAKGKKSRFKNQLVDLFPSLEPLNLIRNFISLEIKICRFAIAVRFKAMAKRQF